MIFYNIYAKHYDIMQDNTYTKRYIIQYITLLILNVISYDILH